MTANIRLVVVDDSMDIRVVLRLALEAEGFEVVAEAANGIEAIEAVERERPDGVILDLAMPKMDGFDAMDEIRRISPATKIVVVTAAGKAMMAEAAGRGADFFVDKTVAARELPAILRSVFKVGGEDPGRTND